MTNKQANDLLSDFYNDMFNTFQNLGGIDLEAWENAVKTQNDMFTLWASFCKKQYDILTLITDPQDLAEAERELSAEFVGLSLELAQRSMGYMNETMTGAMKQVSVASAEPVTARPASTAGAHQKKAPKKPATRKKAVARKKITKSAE